MAAKLHLIPKFSHCQTGEWEVATDGVQVRAVRSNGACVLRIAGELDVATADALADHAAASVREVSGPVLVDLSGLTFIDAYGARALDALIRSPPDGRAATIRRCPLRIRRTLNVLRLSLDSSPATDSTAGQTVTTALTDQVRRTRLSARESELDACGTLARLTDTLIRLASTIERTELIREQVRSTLASSRAAHHQLIELPRQGTPTATAALIR
jgi:anti-sigma B factor antagonist